jgi:type VI secretion system protein
MTGYGSLFERLNGDCDIRAGMSREACAGASVAAHLSKMLSTRAGSVQVAPDYGLPDLNDIRLSLHDVRYQACRAIQACIEAYEPRLSHVRVTTMSAHADPLRLCLRIDALLGMDGLKRPVSFSAGLDGSGQLTVNQG